MKKRAAPYDAARLRIQLGCIAYSDRNARIGSTEAARRAGR
jgi:hypothetical protein